MVTTRDRVPGVLLPQELSRGLADLVLRRWPAGQEAKGLVAREASALAAVDGHGLPVPQLLAMDETGAVEVGGSAVSMLPHARPLRFCRRRGDHREDGQRRGR